MKIKISIHKDDAHLDTQTFDQDVIKIGRLKTSHICLNDEAVARMHAVIEVSGDVVRIIDLGSSAGVIFLGSRSRIDKNANLKEGDVLSIGPFHLRIEEFGESEVKEEPSEPDEEADEDPPPHTPQRISLQDLPVANTCLQDDEIEPINKLIRKKWDVRRQSAHLSLAEIREVLGPRTNEVLVEIAGTFEEFTGIVQESHVTLSRPGLQISKVTVRLCAETVKNPLPRFERRQAITRDEFLSALQNKRLAATILKRMLTPSRGGPFRHLSMTGETHHAFTGGIIVGHRGPTVCAYDYDQNIYSICNHNLGLILTVRILNGNERNLPDPTTAILDIWSHFNRIGAYPLLSTLLKDA